MGGCLMFEQDCEEGAADQNVINIVLVGRTGNGKSATGNRILGKKAFDTKSWFRSVTKTCQQQQRNLDDGVVLNVIDTPGLFDPSHDFMFLAREIGKCVSMAEGGIHAVLIVLSLSRFTDEEAAVVSQLQRIFGNAICDHMIVVFTHGDDLEEDENLDARLADSPENLKELLQKCGNRKVVFDNRTRNESKQSEQFSQLQDLMEDIAIKNGYKPYTSAFFEEYQKGVKQEQLLLQKVGESGSAEERAELATYMAKAKDDQLYALGLMVISQLNDLHEDKDRSNETIAQLKADMEKAGDEALAEKTGLRQRITELENHWTRKCTIM